MVVAPVGVVRRSLSTLWDAADSGGDSQRPRAAEDLQIGVTR
jgi:hypothetical protein